MNAVEVIAAATFVALGMRSVVYWARRPFEARDIADHLLFALYLTGRAGLWFAFAGVFVIFGSIDAEGRAFTDEAGDHRWYLLVIAGLGALQMVAGYLLGRRGGSADRSDDVV